MKPLHVQIRSPLIGDFILKIIEKTKEGYVFSEHEVYRLGREYIADLRQPVEEVEKEVVVEAVFQTTSEITTEKTDSEVHTAEGDIHPDTVIPDWELLEKLVRAGDKNAIEAYCKPFGINLKKTQSPANMLKSFKEHVGA